LRTFNVSTEKQVELVNIDHLLQRYLEEEKLLDGIVLLFVPHTTAAVTINENGDPDVQQDIINMLNQVIPFDGGYRHFEGNSAAHIKSSLIGCSSQVIISSGKPQLGTWQSIYFCEFDGPRNRRLWIDHNSTGSSPAASATTTMR
jgi:secondary thiamine-phosphate synthase enzyme